MRYALAFSVLAFTSPALAQSIPAHDVDAACKANAYPDYVWLCVRLEQQGYDLLLQEWPQISDASRQKITAQTESIRNKSQAYYQVLERYVSSQITQDRLAQERANPPRFQR